MKKCVGRRAPVEPRSDTSGALRGLMASEDLDTLGFKAAAEKKKEEKKPEGEDRRQGFIAGLRPKRQPAAEAQR